MIKINQVLAVQTLSALVLSGLLLAIGAPQHSLSSVIGSTIITANLCLLVWLFKLLTAKKSIALVFALIVIKYAVLIGILVILVHMGWTMDFGFALGIGTLFPTLGYFARKYWRENLSKVEVKPGN